MSIIYHTKFNSFESLPSEFHHEIAKYLPISDLINISQTTSVYRRLYQIHSWKVIRAWDSIPTTAKDFLEAQSPASSFQSNESYDNSTISTPLTENLNKYSDYDNDDILYFETRHKLSVFDYSEASWQDQTLYQSLLLRARAVPPHVLKDPKKFKSWFLTESVQFIIIPNGHFQEDLLNLDGPFYKLFSQTTTSDKWDSHERKKKLRKWVLKNEDSPCIDTKKRDFFTLFPNIVKVITPTAINLTQLQHLKEINVPFNSVFLPNVIKIQPSLPILENVTSIKAFFTVPLLSWFDTQHFYNLKTVNVIGIETQHLEIVRFSRALCRSHHLENLEIHHYFNKIETRSETITALYFIDWDVVCSIFLDRYPNCRVTMNWELLSSISPVLAKSVIEAYIYKKAMQTTGETYVFEYVTDLCLKSFTENIFDRELLFPDVETLDGPFHSIWIPAISSGAPLENITSMFFTYSYKRYSLESTFQILESMIHLRKFGLSFIQYRPSLKLRFWSPLKKFLHSYLKKVRDTVSQTLGIQKQILKHLQNEGVISKKPNEKDKALYNKDEWYQKLLQKASLAHVDEVVSRINENEIEFKVTTEVISNIVLNPSRNIVEESFIQRVMESEDKYPENDATCIHEISVVEEMLRAVVKCPNLEYLGIEMNSEWYPSPRLEILLNHWDISNKNMSFLPNSPLKQIMISSDLLFDETLSKVDFEVYPNKTAWPHYTFPEYLRLGEEKLYLQALLFRHNDRFPYLEEIDEHSFHLSLMKIDNVYQEKMTEVFEQRKATGYCRYNTVIDAEPGKIGFAQGLQVSKYNRKLTFNYNSATNMDVQVAEHLVNRRAETRNFDLQSMKVPGFKGWL